MSTYPPQIPRPARPTACDHPGCRTQMHFARRGEVTAAMRTVAEREQVDPETIRTEVAAGRLVIPANVHQIGRAHV